jgi:D-3-phosphoglycerate dehydrogenase
MASSKSLSSSPGRDGLRILAIGDGYFSSAVFAESFASLEHRHKVSYVDIPPGEHFSASTDSERTLREFTGTPEWVANALDGHDVLVVHGAPVSAEVLDASPALGLVCCARGGPVNVDRAAAAERQIPVVTTPGKNAESVADLALAFMVMLARRVPAALAESLGEPLGGSAFEGASFFGHDLGGHTLGLVGFGNVGARVSVRARGFGMRVIAHDPYVSPEELEGAGVDAVALDELLSQADFVSLHARATAENGRMFDAARFGAMKPGSFFLNTARASLVDESALLAVVESGHVAGAALDVLDPVPPGAARHPLTGLENVIVTPHIGGATHETLVRGAQMIAEEIERFASGQELRYAVETRKD